MCYTLPIDGASKLFLKSAPDNILCTCFPFISFRFVSILLVENLNSSKHIVHYCYWSWNAYTGKEWTMLPTLMTSRSVISMKLTTPDLFVSSLSLSLSSKMLGFTCFSSLNITVVEYLPISCLSACRYKYGPSDRTRSRRWFCKFDWVRPECLKFVAKFKLIVVVQSWYFFCVLLFEILCFDFSSLQIYFGICCRLVFNINCEMFVFKFTTRTYTCGLECK